MNAIIEILKAIVFGIIQGITEWLPISSTGHLLLANEFLKMSFSDDFVNTFMVVIQLGSILAVVVLYFDKLWPFYFKTKTKEQRMATWTLWFKILVASIPAGIVGLLFDDLIDSIFYNPLTIAITLIVYGIGFLIVENMKIKENIKTVEDIDYITAANIGLFEMLALIPGTSRSGATILGGRIIGCSKTAVSEFSFFMAIPVMAGASFLKILKCGFAFSLLEWGVLLIGSAVAFAVSMFAIKFLLQYIRKHDFKAFGIYRIVLGALVLVYFYFINK